MTGTLNLLLYNSQNYEKDTEKGCVLRNDLKQRCTKPVQTPDTSEWHVTGETISETISKSGKHIGIQRQFLCGNRIFLREKKTIFCGGGQLST